ncbi:MAG: UvrD-helicase domain-containing protein [Leptospiraceae bacterium]|nr:UvrD-helicase domain-containing protein [Leptospiraceae bacterium]
MNNPILEGLNPQQKEAVLHFRGPLLILAGAGSGKTRVITHRIANLIYSHRIYPFKICALTFTNKAAQEMKERIIKLLPNTGNLVMIKTFHSLGLYILRKHSEKLGIDKNFTVYDSALQESLIKEIVKDLGLEGKYFKPSTVNHYIQSAKDQFISAEEYGNDNLRDSYIKSVKDIYVIYEKRKKERNAFDFGDLIYATVQLFKNFPEVLKSYNEQWEYILVDEYQDTNHSQYLLTKLLVGENQNLCVVGDDDQSIYSWRGADIRNILEFEKDFPNTKVIKLEENYRSTKTIISSASELIKNNQGRKDKTLFTNNTLGEKIKIIECESEPEEASLVVELIQRSFEKTKTYLRYAIFYRTNAQSRFFEEELRKRNIPYKIYGGFRFFDRMEIKDMLAYLSVLINPNDTSSLLRIINFPSRGIGEATIEKLRTRSLELGKPLYEILSKNDLGLRKQTQAALTELYTNFEDLKEKLSKGYLPSQVTKSLIVQMRIDEEFTKTKDEESIDRMANIEQLIESIEEYEESTENPSLAEYLGQVALLTSEEDTKELKDYVTLMTVHNSKGLEFDEVFLVGMEQGTFPHFMNLENNEGLEEERRLCYVAITRAKEKLTVTYNNLTRRFGAFEPRIPSMFLNEIPDKYVEHFVGEQVFRRKPETTPKAGQAKLKKTKSSSEVQFDSRLLQLGTKVKHTQYGVGEIVEVVGSGENTKIKVSFSVGNKNFLAAYTNLQILN